MRLPKILESPKKYAIKLKNRFFPPKDEPKSQFGLFISLSLIISIILSGVSLWLYNESGAAQLDLSRPSYQEARQRAREEEEKEAKADEFSPEGKIDKNTIDEFKKIFKDRQSKIQADAFKGDPLSDETLNIEQDGEEPVAE